MIRVESISKIFGGIQAASDISFDARDGKVTALLGPNGAGKSTTLRILSTIIKPSSGDAFIDGNSVRTNAVAVRRLIGVLPHRPGLYGRLTARENIRYFGQLQGLSKAALVSREESLIDLLDIGSFADRRAAGFSQGQRIKVGLARALIHDPKHLLLDEPTSGLDVSAIRALREIVLQLRDLGRCIVFSSHIMQEVTNLCDDLVIIGQGTVRFLGTPEQLQQRTAKAGLEDAFLSILKEP